MQPKAAHAINETDKEKNGITQCHDYHKVDLFPSVVIPVVIEFYFCPRLGNCRYFTNLHIHIICLCLSATVWWSEMCKLDFAQTLLLCSWARPRMRTVRKYFYCTCCSEKSPDNVWWCIVHTADDKCQRRWMMENAYCTLHTAHCILHTAYYILHTAYCPLNTAQFGESFRKVFNIHIAYCNW